MFRPWEVRPPQETTGSGVILEGGRILTNAHVVKDAVQIFVRPDARIPFMYMPDALRALVELACAPAAKLTRRTYNIAACSPSAAEIAEALQRRLDHPFEVRYVPDHRQDYVDSWPRRLVDTSARRDWGWQERYGLEAMTDALLDACRAALRRA